MGILQTIITKYKDAQQKSLNKQKLREVILQAVADGKISPEEIEQIEKSKNELGLADSDVKELRMEVFTKAFKYAKSDQKVTKEEEDELLKIQKYFGLADDEMYSDKKELARLRLLNEIQQGNIPELQVSNLVKQKDEKVYWVEKTALIEEKVIKRKYQGGSHGYSFRLMKGVSYRVGSSRGHIASETGMVVVSTGNLIITSKRIVFVGDSKSFSVKLDKLIDLQLFTNCIQFSESNKTKPRMVRFEQKGSSDIIGAILSYAVNNYNSK